MQEVFYEESVDTHNQSSAKKKFTLFRVVSIISFICGAFSIVLLLTMRVPESGIGTPQIIMIVFFARGRCRIFCFRRVDGEEKTRVFPEL